MASFPCNLLKTPPSLLQIFSLYYTEWPSAERPTMYLVHPHGIFCLGWSLLFSRPEMGHVSFCFSNALYYSPLFRIVSKLIGNPSKCDAATMKNHMKRKRSLALIPGGFEEASVHSQSADRVFLKNRKGFVKYALQHGYALSPVYAFGENKTFMNLQGMWSLRLKLNSYGVPAIVPFGRWWCPVLPVSSYGMHVVVGAALQLPHIAQPTNEEVGEWHSKYMDALKSLYDKHRTKHKASEQLEIW